VIATLNAWGGIWAGYFGLALIQHTLFLGVIFLGLYLARNAPAGLRYSLCFLGMAKLLLPPFMPAGFLARAGLAFSTGAANPASGFVTLLPAGTLPVAGPEGQLVRTPGISPPVSQSRPAAGGVQAPASLDHPGLMAHNQRWPDGCRNIGEFSEDKRFLIRPERGEALLPGRGINPFHPAHLR
jgi:hypothetical protein